MHAAFRKSGALRKAPDALLPMFTNRVENANTFGPQSHRVGPCSEGWLKSWRKSALQSTRSTTGCPALGEYSVQLGWNVGLQVSTVNMEVVGICSITRFNNSRVVGSVQCKSSTMKRTGCCSACSCKMATMVSSVFCL